MKLSEIIMMINNRDLSKNTKKTYRNFYIQYADFVCKKTGTTHFELDHTCLDRDNLLGFKNYLESKACTPSTITTGIYAIKFLMRVAEEDFKLKMNASSIRIPKRKKVEFKGQTNEDLLKIYELVKNESPRDSMIIALMVLCGLRVKEVKELTLGQVEENYLLNVNGKGDRLRDLPLPFRIQPIIKRFMMWRSLFPMSPDYPFIVSLKNAIEGNPKSYELNEKTIYSRVKIALTKIGCAITNPHSLRHAYGYQVLEHVGRKESNPARGLATAKTLLGHANIQTTLTYTESPLKILNKLLEDL